MNILHIVKAREAITDKHGTKKPQNNIADDVGCPVCTSGTLSYRISAYNGHISAKCSTQNCVSWVE